jgi:hypothetical protein
MFVHALERALSAESREKFGQQRRMLDDRVFVSLSFEQFRPEEGDERFFRLQSFSRFLHDRRLSASACGGLRSSQRTGDCSPSSSLSKKKIEARPGATMWSGNGMPRVCCSAQAIACRMSFFKVPGRSFDQAKKVRERLMIKLHQHPLHHSQHAGTPGAFTAPKGLRNNLTLRGLFADGDRGWAHRIQWSYGSDTAAAAMAARDREVATFAQDALSSTVASPHPVPDRGEHSSATPCTTPGRGSVLR